jgi:hypothetical protein
MGGILVFLPYHVRLCRRSIFLYEARTLVSGPFAAITLENTAWRGVFVKNVHGLGSLRLGEECGGVYGRFFGSCVACRECLLLCGR